MGNKRRKVEEPESESEDEEFDEDIQDAADDGDDDGEDTAQEGLKRQFTYDVDALHERLEDIGWTTEADWEESLVVTSEQPTVVENVDDDLARELAFYNQALASAKHAIHRFEEAGIPWLRPLDYYAEMVKSDEHMAKVKEQLMFEQRRIEQAEERRKQREAKMYGKQVQLVKQKERNAEKKRQITEISKLRKQREKSGFDGELDMDAQLEQLEQHRPLNLKQLRQRGRKDDRRPNKKRQMKDAKFGFGGRKSLKKQNDAYSSADVDDCKQGRFKATFGPRKGGVQKKFGAGAGAGGKKAQKGGKSQRPGKQRRQAMKGGKGGMR